MKIVIVGAGGHAAVVADILLRMREAGARVEPIVFLDEAPQGPRRDILPLRVIPGGLGALTSTGCDAAIVAIGDNAARRRISEQLRQGGMLLAIARHPFSVVAPDVDLAPGVVVCAGAVINPSTRVGCSAIVNTHSSVDHHNSIGDYAHVAPGAHLGGGVTVGDDAMIGIGAMVLPGRKIGRRSVVGAGSVVTRDLPDDVVATGTPAHIRRRTTTVESPRPVAGQPA